MYERRRTRCRRGSLGAGGLVGYAVGTMGASDDMLGADPFSTADPFDGGPHLSPMATPEERKALLNELRGLIQTGEYQIDPEIVAVAVMREGRWETT